MTTLVIRHGRTPYSARYLVNGDPSAPVLLDEEGLRSTAALRGRLAPRRFSSYASSTFPRTRQTIQLLTGSQSGHRDARLNELDYGRFEGGPFATYARWLLANGPWAVPPGAAESQRDGMLRMLGGLRGQLHTPGPRLIVAHGLLVSLLSWHRAHAARAERIPLFLPEAPYAEPIVATDDEITEVTKDLARRLGAEPRCWRGPGDAAISSEDDSTVLALFGPVSVSLEENESDA
ncbi:putative phosphoglycerate mutase [Nocardiopsis mwathae]|uniref:Putative phosphoglycerate mutase n=1 Tax=Nocardiopsis mwathae TaxID=1472723 RepID=A0A7W9YLR2_9ACTN|nr:histidine phosphatase family protein [Nocardiopsis mwathae]MBB6174493.1 putative phosphoglycerate mutase [Nocardiopsis mwathae]